MRQVHHLAALDIAFGPLLEFCAEQLKIFDVGSH